MENILEIKNLNLFFRGNKEDYQALYDVNMTFEKGKIHSIVGESGCGKTMTVMSVMNLLPKNAYIKTGEIIFENDNLLKYDRKKMRELRGNRIALIPQDPMTSLNPLYTIGNQITETIRAHSKVSEHQALRKAREVLDMVKIPDINNKLNSYPHEFSGGMKQRVIIAMAIVCKPELIIADEPTTALDVTIQKQIMDLICELQQETKTTVILISHDLALVSNYADTVAVMYSGRIAELASSQEFFTKPLHPYSAALLNSLPTSGTGKTLNTISGAPPEIREKIFGCKFHPRCKLSEAGLCDTKIPDLEEKLQNHFASCHKVIGF